MGEERRMPVATVSSGVEPYEFVKEPPGCAALLRPLLGWTGLLGSEEALRVRVDAEGLHVGEDSVPWEKVRLGVSTVGGGVVVEWEDGSFELALDERRHALREHLEVGLLRERVDPVLLRLALGLPVAFEALELGPRGVSGFGSKVVEWAAIQRFAVNIDSHRLEVVTGGLLGTHSGPKAREVRNMAVLDAVVAAMQSDAVELRGLAGPEDLLPSLDLAVGNQNAPDSPHGREELHVEGAIVGYTQRRRGEVARARGRLDEAERVAMARALVICDYPKPGSLLPGGDVHSLSAGGGTDVLWNGHDRESTYRGVAEVLARWLPALRSIAAGGTGEGGVRRG